MNFESFCEIENHFERGLYDHQDPLINVYLKSLVLFSQGHFDDFYKCLSERNLQTETFEKACGFDINDLSQ